MKIQIFDIDHTLIRRSTAWCFILEALRRRAISLSQVLTFPLKWLKYKYAGMSIDFVEQSIRTLEGFPEPLFREIARDAFLRYGRRQLFQDGVALIKALRMEGHRILIATSSVDILVKPICDYLGVQDLVASRLEFSDGHFTGRMVGSSAFGDNKKSKVEQWLSAQKIKPEQACFYSDSWHDLPLLRLCGKAVAVNPDPRLRRHARKREWQILRFRRVLGNRR